MVGVERAVVVGSRTVSGPGVLGAVKGGEPGRVVGNDHAERDG